MTNFTCPGCNIVIDVPKTLSTWNTKRPRYTCKICHKTFDLSKKHKTSLDNPTGEWSGSNIGLQRGSNPSPVTNNGGGATNRKSSTGNTNIAPTVDPISDPDELLYSVAIRELNKSQPDPRWANILITCITKIHKTKKARQDLLQNKPTNNLLSMIEKSSGKPLAKEPSPIPSLLEE